MHLAYRFPLAALSPLHGPARYNISLGMYGIKKCCHWLNTQSVKKGVRLSLVISSTGVCSYSGAVCQSDYVLQERSRAGSAC